MLDNCPTCFLPENNLTGLRTVRWTFFPGTLQRRRARCIPACWSRARANLGRTPTSATARMKCTSKQPWKTYSNLKLVGHGDRKSSQSWSASDLSFHHWLMIIIQEQKLGHCSRICTMSFQIFPESSMIFPIRFSIPPIWGIVPWFSIWFFPSPQYNVWSSFRNKNSAIVPWFSMIFHHLGAPSEVQICSGVFSEMGAPRAGSGPRGVLGLAAGVAREHHGRGWHEIYLRAVACNECNACIAPKKHRKKFWYSKYLKIISIYIKSIKWDIKLKLHHFTITFPTVPFKHMKRTMVVHCSRLVASTSFTAGQVRLHLAQSGGSAAGAVSGALETRQHHGWELKPLGKMVGSYQSYRWV